MSSPETAALLAFLDASPSPYHAVSTATDALAKAGYSELLESDAWSSVSGKHFVRRAGALLAWNGANQHVTEGGFRIIGAHTDSPNLRIKPQAATSSAGYKQIGVEIYGGILNNSWLDRDLGISGRVVLHTGEVKLVRIDRPLARVSQLAIHLDREVNEKGLVLDKQLHLFPMAGLGQYPATFEDWLGMEMNLTERIVTHDLMFHDLTPAATLGIDNEFVVSARIDNLFSCWAATQALTDGDPGVGTPMIALFDHEEVGSSSTTGAAGPLLEVVLERICEVLGLGVGDRARAFAASSCISSDMAHAVHPNYADRHEPEHRPVPNGGPVLKSNANQRYATNAVGAAQFQAACERAQVPVQFFVSKNSQPCGSTIGPITATRLGIETIDVGCAMLSMHSARELCGADDAALYLRALTSYLAQ
jgi:aspartyl aminopeptidase